MTKRASRLAVRAGVALACAALAGCGVRTQSEPDTIDRGDVPFDLLERTPRTGASTPAEGASTYVLYFVEENAVVATTRSQRRPITTTNALRLLVRGVTPEEAARRLSTAIPSGSTVRRVAVRGRVATIDLDGAFDSVSSEARILAFAQLVFTATESPSVTHVRFELGGSPIDVPTVDGRLTSEPVSRGDYGPAT